MVPVTVEIVGLIGLDQAIARGRTAAMPKMAEAVRRRAANCVATQTDPWGAAWRPRSQFSEGTGPLLTALVPDFVLTITDTSFDLRVADEHATSHIFGRARKGTRSGRRAGFRGERMVALRSTLTESERQTRGVASATRANSAEPPRPMLPLRVRQSGRQEPLVDWPADWLAELNAILDAEIQREIDALSTTTG